MKAGIFHTGRVKNGKLLFDVVDFYNQEILALEGKNFVLTIKEKHKKPSNNQFGYYRGGILPVCYESEQFKHMDKKDDIHEYYFAPKFLSYKKEITVNGVLQTATRTRSLSELTSQEMSEFIERVLADCAEMGISVPPAESFYNKYYKQ